MKCEFCSVETQIPFTCNFCEGHFCSEHRLPENHACPRAPPRLPLGNYEAKQRLMKKTTKKESVSSILYPNTYPF